ncbi:MAG TPA: hypothetical protein ENF67_01625, partial [Candidatus Pacearchaeota archaeon]|nr:hypothetical protein [Candidatus Pacearchaeota archaeon]
MGKKPKLKKLEDGVFETVISGRGRMEFRILIKKYPTDDGEAYITDVIVHGEKMNLFTPVEVRKASGAYVIEWGDELFVKKTEKAAEKK